MAIIDNSFPLLSTLIGLPVLGAVIVLMCGDNTPARLYCAKAVALAVTLVSLLLCLPLFTHFDVTTSAMQFREHLTWIPAYKLYYDIGVDGISMPLVVLTAYTGLLVVIASFHMVKENLSQYLASFLIIQGMIIGIFCALDAILFYLFWEAVLIPMYLSVGIWGGGNRSYAAIKFFLYTFTGSVLLLAALIYLGIKADSFSILSFYPLKLNLTEQILIFIGFLLAFGIKVPLWPVHTWLPDAHTEAPTGGSVILAALMLKIGAYGFLRFSLPITPDASHTLAWLMIALSIIAIVYVGLVALAQTDMKQLIAYSSIAHMGFVTLGFFVIYSIVHATGHSNDAYIAVEGAMVQMISHGFSSGALFLGFGMLYDRMHTRDINSFGGVANVMPALAAFFLLFCLSNAGLPGTSGFVGEFMVLMGTIKANLWLAAAAGLTLIIAPTYTFGMYKRVFYGEVSNEHIASLTPIVSVERLLCVLLVIAILGLGLYPKPLLEVFHASTAHLIKLSMHSKLIG